MRVLLLEDGAKAPSRAYEHDAGWDLSALYGVVLAPGGRALVRTGVVIAVEPGQVAMVCPRSGLALKHGVTVLNAPGIVDAGYRGEVGVVLHNTSGEEVEISAGDKVAQLVVTGVDTSPLQVVGSLDETSRSGSGFGSSGS